MLAPNRFEFEWGGSGSCPPVATSATVNGDTLVVPVEPAHASFCTLDRRRYAVAVTLNAAVLAPNAHKPITSITVRYLGGRLRLPLLSA